MTTTRASAPPTSTASGPPGLSPATAVLAASRWRRGAFWATHTTWWNRLSACGMTIGTWSRSTENPLRKAVRQYPGRPTAHKRRAYHAHQSLCWNGVRHLTGRPHAGYSDAARGVDVAAGVARRRVGFCASAVARAPQKLGTFQGIPTIVGSLGGFCSTERAAEDQQFFDKNAIRFAERTLRQALERIESCTVLPTGNRRRWPRGWHPGDGTPQSNCAIWSVLKCAAPGLLPICNSLSTHRNVERRL